jgi:hypothetical protein
MHSKDWYSAWKRGVNIFLESMLCYADAQRVLVIGIGEVSCRKNKGHSESTLTPPAPSNPSRPCKV